MSLAILSSSIKGSLRSSARVAAVAKPSSAWTSRFYSTENNNTTETKDNKDATAAAGPTEEKTDKDAKSAHEEALAAKDKQLAEVKDRLLRTLADMENLRQRTAKENVPQEEVAETSTNAHLKNLHTGVSMTRDELLKTFKRYGVEPYDPINEKFDPNLHQANFQVPMPGKEPGTVFDVQKIGFMIKGRVLRPAQVGVVQSTD
ncbi:Mitochondrial matrix cochaperone [Podila verticillata]|nr:Mitochondrial matrix cochaperone [Podila verticillata]